MKWIVAVIAILIILWFLAALRLKKRDLRVKAVIRIPSQGEPIVTLSPVRVPSEDLIGLLLSYGTKLRWILMAEPLALQEHFEILVREMVLVWPLAEDSLINAMPTAQAVSNLPDRVRAVPNGEEFVVRFFRTNYKTLRNYSSIINRLPRPGLASNLVWNYVLLANEIFGRLNSEARTRGEVALALWQERLFSPELRDDSLSGLERLMTEADYAFEVSGVAPVVSWAT